MTHHGETAAEISAFDLREVMSMYTGGVRKNTTKMTRKKYDQIIALRRSPSMLPRRAANSGLGAAPADVTQDQYRRDRQDGKHEQRYGSAQGQIAAFDADLEGPGREHMRLVHRPAGGQDPHDVEIRERDDQRKQRGDRDDVAHHRQCDVPQLLPPVCAVDRRRLVKLLGDG